MKIMTVLGARPQFIKASVVSRALQKKGLQEILVHTGQHYDSNMSDVFFSELDLSDPDVNLEVGSGSNEYQVSETALRLEPVCVDYKPDVLMVYGDTNATLAGALVGNELNIPVAHVEAGLRSYDDSMPEERNRVRTDAISDFLFCPTETAVSNLLREGIDTGVANVGDVMYDASVFFWDEAKKRSGILESEGLMEKGYVLVTIHRDFNVDNTERLTGIVDGLMRSGRRIVFPAHPRVRKQLAGCGLMGKMETHDAFHVIEPVGYLDMLMLEMSAEIIVTDSGGVQKEAFFCQVPCVTVRSSTEWVETVDSGWNSLVDASTSGVSDGIAGAVSGSSDVGKCFGDGHASEKIAEVFLGYDV